MENIGFFGGDLRIVKLAELFSKNGYEVYTYGLEEAKFKKRNIRNTTLEKVIENTNIIFGSIPFSKDNEEIFSPFSRLKLNIKEIFPKIKNKKFITGAINEKFIEIAKKYDIEIIDILENEELATLNAIPTAEGAIQVAMEQTEFTIHNSKCLILGFGRIGKILTKMLLRNGGKRFM